MNDEQSSGGGGGSGCFISVVGKLPDNSSEGLYWFK
jgi:hypothetical protein